MNIIKAWKIAKAQAQMNNKGEATNKLITAAIGIFVLVIVLQMVGDVSFGLNISGAPAWFNDNITSVIALVFFLLVLAAGGIYKLRGR